MLRVWEWSAREGKVGREEGRRKEGGEGEEGGGRNRTTLDAVCLSHLFFTVPSRPHVPGCPNVVVWYSSSPPCAFTAADSDHYESHVTRWECSPCIWISTVSKVFYVESRFAFCVTFTSLLILTVSHSADFSLRSFIRSHQLLAKVKNGGQSRPNDRLLKFTLQRKSQIITRVR